MPFHALTGWRKWLGQNWHLRAASQPLETLLAVRGGRRVHKSANTDLSRILTNTEGPWVEKGKDVDRHWDSSSTWLQGIEHIVLDAKNSPGPLRYCPLDSDLVFDTFCEPIKQSSSSRTGE